ncbi:MAG: SUMF1/EgtB/PvdO family nonheme iron enzyme [Planctomycetes bacterium]|nr:SUMF1/EgtB/PvdO family nonheme iron enzyme [Planctomycetota bacterium]
MSTHTPDPDRRHRAKLIFDHALGLPPQKREAYVRREAGDDHELAEDVLAILREHAASGPDHIGPYRILEQIGEGGMGIVYLAEQKEPIRRRVAVKLIKRGMDSKSVLARFEAERRALSLMEHSCIATVLDGGATNSGQPYFVMEFVKGIPITAYCDQNKLSLRDRIGLFQKVCSGVQHAHMKGVMHRDLKPGNVLVTLQDGTPIPKIIDFGLAKATDHHLVEQTIYTEHGVLIGTPEYMSPEQAGLGGLDVDTRTDIYSLGVMLHELLVGELPFSRNELRSGGMMEMQRVIREEEPTKPSTKITTLGDAAIANAAARRMQTGELQRQLRGDLDWIVLRALEKDRTRRYQTAQELAADLERYLNDEPVLAGPPTASYVLRKLYRRYKAPLLAGAGIVCALAIGLILAVWQWTAANDAKLDAETARNEAVGLRGVAEANLANFKRLRAQVQLDDFVAKAQLFTETSTDGDGLRTWMRECEQWLKEVEDPTAPLKALENGARQADGSLAFRDPADKFLHDALSKLARELAAFQATGGTLDRTRRAFAWASTVHQKTVVDHASKWKEVHDWAAAHPDFLPLDLLAQEGLIPLERDPESGLWEFLFARSGERPVRENGRWVITPETGIVMVLVPGGETTLGTDSTAAFDCDRAVHKVVLAPYFLSKYETTQTQWERLTGTNPSFVNAKKFGPETRVHPVESIQWNEAVACATRFGLRMPTEAQWEHACRARALPRTAWFFGDTLASLVDEKNEVRFNAAEGSEPNIEDSLFHPDLNDGFPMTSPVGYFAANRWGLHDMHGNVAELTRDNFAGYDELATRPEFRFAEGTGEMVGFTKKQVGHRGGSWFKRVEAARSFARKGIERDARYHNIGVRFARELTR